MRFARNKDEYIGPNSMEATMQHPQASQAGFSMVELLVAVAIMAVGLLGLAELQISAIKTNAHSSELIAANALAQSAVEEVVGLSPDSVLFGPTQVLESANAALPGFENVTVAGGGNFRVQYWTFPNYQPNLCQVWVRVQGLAGTKLSRPVTMTTLKRWRVGGA